MHISIKKYAVASLLISSIVFSSAVSAKNIPIFFLNQKSAAYTAMTALTKEKLLSIVTNYSKTVSSQNVAQIKAQVVLGQYQQPSYLLIYLLSAKDYSFSITKITFDKAYRVTSIIPNYSIKQAEVKQQQQSAIEKPVVCPDKTVEFIAATPVPDYPTAKAAIEYIDQQAQTHGYKTVKLLGEEANVKNYTDWLACPQLKGFFNVGHGSNSGILLADGMFTSDVFKTLLKNKLHEHSVILFNSCQVDNDPLKSAITEDADAQKYAGGISNLAIGPSEEASKCFWDAAFLQEKLTISMKLCNKKYDGNDQFGIGGHGADFLRPAKQV